MAGQRLTVIRPLEGEKAYQIAAETFVDCWEKITGQKPRLLTYISPYDTRLPDGDLVLIGSDAVHPVVHDLIRRGVVASLGIRDGTDDYRMLSVPDKERTLLILAGGSGRATIYAVYEFFRRQAGAEYFWDGDILPQHAVIPVQGIDVLEKPRFEYRGLRYFAHRGLHRFQAEHWDLEDWKKEIDWLLKKRFNLFMLRTGIDDLFQRAFPGKVEYPPTDARDPDAIDRSYNDRTSFWPVRYRGELRREVLRYAADRGLLHPEDAGTITHWYSHTPSSLYRTHPGFPVMRDEKGDQRTPPTHAVWEPEYPGTWEAYWKLTKTHIREYSAGSPRLFHTIGLAERSFGMSDEENLRRKLYVYRKTQQMIRQRYPDVPLLFAGWDFYGWWKNEDVKRFLEELDARRSIVIDYTADHTERTTYRDWALYGRFPWIFGIFYSFARNSGVHGDNELLAARVADAARDAMCLGLVVWSEISHSDTFLLEYLAENSWKPERPDPASAVARYCRTRYSLAIRADMDRVWTAFLPIAGAAHFTERGPGSITFREPQFRVLTSSAFLDLTPDHTLALRTEWKRIRPRLESAPDVLGRLGAIASRHSEDRFWRRDALDMARTIASRALLAAMVASSLDMEAWRMGESSGERTRKLSDLSARLLDAWADVLSFSDEFSMHASLKRLEAAQPIAGVTPTLNPLSEQTLKSNAENDYCRSHHYELVRHLYVPEHRTYWQWVMRKMDAGDKSAWRRPPEFARLWAEHRDRFYATPLADMAPSSAPRSPVGLARALTNLESLVRELVSFSAYDRR